MGGTLCGVVHVQAVAVGLLSEKRPIDANLELDWKSVIFLLKMDEKWIRFLLSFANQDV